MVEPTPALLIGALELIVTEFAREADERGGDVDWRKRNWKVQVYAATDEEAATIRSAFGDGGSYRRSINGYLVGDPVYSVSGRLLGSAVSVGVEITDDSYTRADDVDHFRTISLKFREE